MTDHTDIQLPVTAGQRMTATEFLALPETTHPIELIHGEVVMPPTPMHPHQMAVINLIRVIDTLTQEGTLMVAPMAVHLDDDNVVEPDVFWVAPASASCVLKGGYWHGAPELVIEVLSPSTTLRDRREKFALYEKHGVREYWLGDPVSRTMEIYVREDEKFVQRGLYGPGETFPAAIFNDRTASIDKIFQEASP